MTTTTTSKPKPPTTQDNTRRNRRDDGRGRHSRRSARGPSATAATIEAASTAAMACARPLHVILPACATNKIALPPAPLSAKYAATFEVEFVNASPDAKIDLALAMRVDGHALLRNVQEVEANARRCVRLQVEVEVPKGHVASLSWRPFSRKPERLPAWLTIGRGEAHMVLSVPVAPTVTAAANAPQQQQVSSSESLTPTEALQGSALDQTMSTCPDDSMGIAISDANVEDDGTRRHHRRHRRDRHRQKSRGDEPPRRRHRDSVQQRQQQHTDASRERRPRGGHRDTDTNDSRPQQVNPRRDHRDIVAAKRGAAPDERDATSAAVATALAAVAAARNMHNGDDDDDDDEESVGNVEDGCSGSDHHGSKGHQRQYGHDHRQQHQKIIVNDDDDDSARDHGRHHHHRRHHEDSASDDSAGNVYHANGHVPVQHRRPMPAPMMPRMLVPITAIGQHMRPYRR